MNMSPLAELVLHLSHDAGVNGSKFTATPFGKLAIVDHPDALWTRTDVSGEGPGHDALVALRSALAANTEVLQGRTVGKVFLDMTDGSVWKRAVEAVGEMPDMVRDVIGPAIQERLAAES